jgi:uncharacterized protein YggE
MTSTRRALGAAALFLSVVGTVGAQEPVRPSQPQIVTSGRGEVRVAPDRANIAIGVETRAATAAEASATNARKQKAVIDAIKLKGVPADQISTMNFGVHPETRQDRPNGPFVTTSYLVTNTVSINLQRVDLVGAVIDAAISAGANQINSLDFYLANPDSARRAALTIAVARARGDAEVAAKAAGGTLGPLIEMTVMDFEMPRPMPMMSMAMKRGMAEGTPIESGQQAVTASVSVRWQFVQGAKP